MREPRLSESNPGGFGSDHLRPTHTRAYLMPAVLAACVFDLLEPGGTAVISTPFHGYFKNLVLSLTGKMDGHFTPLWDYGHIKFWSIKTLGQLLGEAGFQDVRWVLVGRVPPLAKSMIAIARRPLPS